MLSLSDALKPRPSVFDRTRMDTVWNLGDLAALDAAAFFAENYITEAMRVLLPEAFKRLEQSAESAAGIFHLSQAMGGGKTHSLLALGLLARDPSMRSQVLSECGYAAGQLGAVRVLAFSGGADPTPNGLWGYLAEKVGNPDALKACYSPLRAPTETEWTVLLSGDPTLILLDELPPYFSGIRAIQTGATSLDEVTTIALRNLFAAVHTNKLPNVCIVLTDLAGTAYQGSAGALASLADAEHEANRVAITLSPVNLNTDELYHILRRRLFSEIPVDSEVIAVADAYVEAAERARNMGLITEVPASLRQRLIESYPFHPAIRDLYARVKENSGFQQTRALIRIMRLMARDLWESGRAKQKYLIAGHDYDLLGQAMKSEIAQINSTFEAAVAKDIQASGGTATAQQIDGASAQDAEDAAKLLFLSSLSTAVTPTLGLHRAEVAEYLAEPHRDLSRLHAAIDKLQETAWYLHVAAGSKLVFRNTENLIAKVEEYVRNATSDMREQDLRKRLGELFKPETGAVYQEVLPLTPLDQVVAESDKIKLLIYRPTAESKQAVEEFFAQQTYKNRVCFLTSDTEPYLTALERAAYLAAVERVMAEPTFTVLNENDPQRKQAGDLREQYQSRFHQALSEGFTKLRYPYAKGLFETELQGTMQTVSQGGVTRYVCRGEPAIKQTLVEMGKFVEDGNPESLLPKLERIWPDTQKQIEWNEVKRLAATTAGYAWHHPKALDYLRDAMVKKEEWRIHGGWVERGPFPKPTTFVEVTTLSVDQHTGIPTIRVRPTPANGVIHHSTTGEATASSARLEKLEFETRELSHSFLCVDPSGAHPQGPAHSWSFRPRVKYGFQAASQGRLIMLVAEPAGQVRYTTDGSSVDTSGHEYTGPFHAAPASLVQARAEGQGVKGDVLQFRVPPEDQEFVIDPKKPAVWRHEHALDSTSETYRFLEACKTYAARLGRLVRLTAAKDGRATEMNTFEGEYDALRYVEAIEMLRSFVADASITLTVEELHFGAGQDLLDLAKDLSMSIGSGEVEQAG